MKRSIILCLLAVLLLLSGCRAEQPQIESADGSETTVAETEPAPSKEQPPIIKFWETVDEMSLEEAKAIIEQKLKQIQNDSDVGTMTAEDRMAMYVYGCERFENLRLRLSTDDIKEGALQINIILKPGCDITYLEKNVWSAQEEFSRFAALFKTVHNKNNGIYLGSTYTKELGLDENLEQLLAAVNCGPYVSVVVHYDSEDTTVKEQMYKELFPLLLRYYLSLGDVAFVDEVDLWRLVSGEIE